MSNGEMTMLIIIIMIVLIIFVAVTAIRKFGITKVRTKLLVTKNILLGLLLGSATAIPVFFLQENGYYDFTTFYPFNMFFELATYIIFWLSILLLILKFVIIPTREKIKEVRAKNKKNIIVKELFTTKELFDKGILTEDEYNTMIKKLKEKI